MKQIKHTHTFKVYMKVCHINIVAKNQKDAEKKAQKFMKERSSLWHIDNKPVMELIKGDVTEIK